MSANVNAGRDSKSNVPALAGGAEITYWDRAANRAEIEQVYGEKAVQWVYGTSFGQKLADGPLSGHAFSRVYGWYQSSFASRGKIEPFIKQFRIPMDEFEPGPFRSFNEFFVRRFRPGARPFVADPTRLAAFAEARYLAFERVKPDDVFPVKGQHLSAAALLGNAELARDFNDGPLLLARLCPTDYHRFHYPDDGEAMIHYVVPGRLHSVNPFALRYDGQIFARNERQVSILQTRGFGKLAYVEVGALCVGRIVQTHKTRGPFRRGDEKGMFLFGGSTVIVLGQKGAWTPEEDLLRETARRRETLIRLGDAVARA